MSTSSETLYIHPHNNEIPKIFILEDSQKWLNYIDFKPEKILEIEMSYYLLDTDISPKDLKEKIKIVQSPNMDLILFLNIIRASWILDRKLGNLFYLSKLDIIFHIGLESILEEDKDIQVECFKFKVTTDQSVTVYHGKKNKVFLLK